MAETEETNTKIPPAPTERKENPSEEASLNDNIRCKEVIEQLQTAFKLPSNVSSSIVCEIQQMFRRKDDTINELSQKTKDHDKLVDAVRDIAPLSRDSNVDTVIYQLRASWRRQEATRIVIKKKLDGIKEKFISNGSCEHQCSIISENAALRKQNSEMKKRLEQLMLEYKRVKGCTSDQQQIGNQDTEPEKLSDEPNRKTKEELACLHFENDNNRQMVDRLRQMLSSFHQNIVISSGTLQVSPVSQIDQAVLAMFSKIPVKRLNPATLQLWRNKSTDIAEEILIGQGAFGKVNLMRYLPTNIPVAVKVQEKKNRGMMLSADELKNKLISRSMKEAIMHHVMSDNPSFPGLFGVVDIEDNLALVLEFIGDKRFAIIHPLCDVLFERRTGLSRLEWIDIALDIIQGLASLHDKGLLHNDLKKNNILLQRSGERWRAYIIDFGHGSTITMPLKFPTFTLEEEREYLEGLLYHHLAPEIVTDQHPTSVYSDVYSLGKVLLDIGRVSGDRDIRILAEMCTRGKPYRRPSISNIELSVIRSKQKAQQ